MNNKNTKKFKYWQAAYLAFFSRTLYLDVVRSWRGCGLVYFVFIIALSALPLGLKTMCLFNQYYNEQLLEPLQKMPTLDIHQGRLASFNYFMPFLVKNKQGDVVIVIDKTQRLTEVNYIYPKWIMLVTDENMYFRLPGFSILPGTQLPTRSFEAISFKEIQEESFNASLWIERMHLLEQKWVFLLMIYPSIIAILYGFFCGLNALMAIVGRVIAHTIFKISLNYREAYRLMLVSSGCGVSLFILGLNFTEQIPRMGIYLMLLMAFYFSYALVAIKQSYRQLMVV